MSLQLVSPTEYRNTIHSLLEQKKYGDAHALCIAACNAFSGRVSLMYLLAETTKLCGDNANALLYGRQALALYNPDTIAAEEISYINDLGSLFIHLEQYELGRICLTHYMTHQPDDFCGIYNMGFALMKAGNFLDALDYLVRADDIYSNFFTVICAGKTAYSAQRLDLAEKYFQKALQYKPEDWVPYACLGNVMQSLGKADEAMSYFKQALARSPGNPRAYFALSELKPYLSNPQNRAELIENLSAQLQNPQLTEDEIINCHFGLGNAYNAQKDYDLAFSHHKAGNILKAPKTEFNVEKFRAGVRRYKTVFTPEYMASVKPHANPSSVPVFIVGMPRSGTSLTNQILASHSKVFSVGETHRIASITQGITPQKINGKTFHYPEILLQLPRETMGAFASNYLQQILPFAEGAQKIIDKMPENFFNIGFIKTILPNATIIHCKRHPLDIIVSMYATNFVSANFPNTFDMLAEYYRCYNQIMAHWHSILPGQIYDQYYEEMVYNQEQQSRALVAFCGLKWQKACLNFYDNDTPVITASKLQVREPVYQRSVFRWKKYAKHLEELRTLLAPEIAEYEAQIVQRVPQLQEQL